MALNALLWLLHPQILSLGVVPLKGGRSQSVQTRAAGCSCRLDAIIARVRQQTHEHAALKAHVRDDQAFSLLSFFRWKSWTRYRVFGLFQAIRVSNNQRALNMKTFLTVAFACVMTLSVFFTSNATAADAAAKAACIAACNECAEECRECIVGCDHKTCELHCLTCIETCQACVALMQYGSPMHGAMCGLCAKACEACAAECLKAGDMPCCKECAEACKKCAETCKAMAM